MNWTEEKPTVPGFYWYRSIKVAEPIIRFVDTFDSRTLRVWDFGEEEDDCAYFAKPEFMDDMPGHWGWKITRQDIDGLWAGPLLPPELREERERQP